ncbi:zinc-binding dehydrogenase [Caldilinea sp.]|uniref:zinc-dependent alcohol dehydrogenase n=1 Tax=Caldilinea sp. TaxID=2293560 RepID=UPI002BCB8099|nr:zinc-binding dehydrogenase [Caldilinea sp.]HRA67856.1 zinc-binding dehydrogenase [Caldilinea sp.]
MKAIMKVAPGVGNVEVREIAEPQPGPGQVKLRVHAAGLCGTDLHIYKDEFRSWPPVVLGHEVAGEIVELGAGVEGLTPGTRVTTETYFSTCGVCRYCRAGNVNLCLERRSIGSAVNGGFTSYLVVPARNLHTLPDNVDFRTGALTEPLACVVHATLTTPTVAPGDVAVIAGPGAIGLLTLQVVKAAGAIAIVLGTDADDHRLALAAQLGADAVVNVQRADAAAVVRDLTVEGLGADVVYECSGAGQAAQQLLTLVRRRGRYVQIGLFGKPVAWNLDQLVYKELTATGSNASTPPSWLRALELMRTGKVRTDLLITHEFPVTAWEKGFATFEDRSGIKTLFVPTD